MEAKTLKWGRLVAAILATLALIIGYSSLTGTIAPARAATDPNYGDINQNATGSIIIHKGTQPGASTPGSVNGTSAPSTFNPLNGVTFTAYPITSLDLSSSTDWDTLSALTVPSTACDGATTTSKPTSTSLGQSLADPSDNNSATTTGNGTATISNLSVKAYLVCETGSPSTVVDKAQPFVVTIPYPDTANQSATDTTVSPSNPLNQWVYDVNVYPKNGVAAISKTVNLQTDLGLGSTATFPTTTTVPSIAPNAKFTHFWIQDPLDPRLNGGDATVTATKADGTTALALTEGTDYTVEAASAANGNLVTVVFTQTGLQTLKANPGAKITTTFTGTVSSVGSGTINNKAYLDSATEVASEPPANPTPDTTPGHDNPGNPSNPSNPSNPNYPGTPSNQVTQNWGQAKLSKVDSGDGTSGLKGAIFEVYAVSDEDSNASTCSSTTPVGSALTVSGTTDADATASGTQFASISGGTVNIPGLFVSDSVHAPISAGQRCYVIKEVQAPAGYVTPSGAAAFTAITVKTGPVTGTNLSAPPIENSKQAVPGLPLTGAQAQMVMIMIGIALLLVALGIVLVTRRRRAQHRA